VTTFATIANYYNIIIITTISYVYNVSNNNYTKSGGGGENICPFNMKIERDILKHFSKIFRGGLQNLRNLIIECEILPPLSCTS